jgi:hypothetical protein
MDQVTLLRDTLRPHLGWHGARLSFVSMFLLFDGKHSLKVSTVFQDLQAAPPQVLRHQRRLWGHWLYIAALRLDHGNLLVVATQCKPQMAIADYANRWGIETLFGIFRH